MKRILPGKYSKEKASEKESRTRDSEVHDCKQDAMS
jgi:hypothetical protein